MAVFITVKVSGPHEALLRAYERIADYEEATVPQLRCHSCAKNVDGIFVAGIWDSREAFEELLARPAFSSLLKELRLPQPVIEIFEVYRSRH